MALRIISLIRGKSLQMTLVSSILLQNCSSYIVVTFHDMRSIVILTGFDRIKTDIPVILDMIPFDFFDTHANT